MVKRKRKKNRLLTDALREVRHTRSRFLSILVLSALAVAFLSGLRTTAPDMEYTADNYYDAAHLMDGYVLSTLGLVEEDLAGILSAHGLTGKRVRVQREVKPLTLTEVFPDLLEGKRSINVKI